MDEFVKLNISIPLTDKELIKKTYNKAKINLYEDILYMTSINELFKSNRQNLKFAIILYRKKHTDIGHWACLILNKKAKTLEYFDPYGNVVDHIYDLNISKYKPYLRNLIYHFLLTSDYEYIQNKTQFQQMKKGISSCGRWVIARIRLGSMNLSVFRNLFLKQTFSSDWYITILTL